MWGATSQIKACSVLIFRSHGRAKSTASTMALSRLIRVLSPNAVRGFIWSLPRGRSIFRVQRLSQFGDVGHNRVAHVAHVLDGTLGGIFVTVTAGVLDEDRYEAEVDAVAHRGVYSDLGGDPANHEGNQAAIAQCHAQRRTFESRHRDLVENRLVRSDLELGRKFKTGAAPEKPRFDGVGTIDALPCHRLTQLKHAREPIW